MSVLIKKAVSLNPLTASVINEINLVKGDENAATKYIQARREAMYRQVKENELALQ